MDQAIPANNSYSYASQAIPVKRKRGRPRKDRSLTRVESVPISTSLDHVENMSVPPGFESVPRQVDPIGDANYGLVGQEVTGVVELAFDAGYLLAVKIGNSNITLRGVIFKPGHYSPVTAENDVAPHVQMIRRSEITENKKRVRARKPRSKEKNNQKNELPPVDQLQRIAPLTANLVKAKYGSLVTAPSVPPVGSRGNVVPVVLQPVNISNGTPLMDLTQPSESHTIPQVIPKVVKSVTKEGEDAKSMQSRQTAETPIGISSSEDSGTVSEQEDGGLNDEALSIEPLQTVHSAYVSNTAGNMNMSGRIT